MAIVIGTDGNDRYNDPSYPGNVELKGTNLADQMYGLAGDDELVGFDGDDVLEGGQGADVLWGGYGFDYASYQGSSPVGVSVSLYGSSGSAYGGDAQGDILHEIEGVIGSAFNDGLGGNDQANVLRGEDGDDVLFGYGGDDTVHGGGGNDLIDGGAGNDRLDGGDGIDTIDGGSGDDVLEGGAGVDRAGFESAAAGVVADLAGGTADGGGHDLLHGIENLGGSYHDDRLAGDGGANRLDGNLGADVLVGRGGADRFTYRHGQDSTAAAPDVIVDFKRAEGDRIDLSGIDLSDEGGGYGPFQFIGQKAFSGVDQVQVRFFKAGGDTVVEVNLTDATAGAEMTIEIDPLVNFQATDFVL